MLPTLILNDEFAHALDLLEKAHASLFITGRAGTGKSTLLQLFRQTTHKKVAVLAPTGIAALNVGGQTIHSFCGFPPRMLDPAIDIKRRRFRKLYEALDVLIIDEISMVRADMLDNIDYFFQLNRNNPQPFGGLQVVFFGDLFQLPPVVASELEANIFRTQFDSPYFFSAKVLQQMELDMLELKTVYRQKNLHFLSILDAIRLNEWSREDMELLNERYQPDFVAPELYITLSARNATVDRINRQELERLPHPAEVFPARISGNFKPQLFPTEAALKLKLEAQVMFVKNDPDRQWVNGTIGKIIKMKTDEITVEIEEDGQRRTVTTERVDWDITRYVYDAKDPDKIVTETLGTFTQFPLKLAWAVTIHKAQGKTFDKVIIDLGRGAFEHGQTYVALSRCRTLEGIVLKQPIRPNDIRIDERIVDYYELGR